MATTPPIPASPLEKAEAAPKRASPITITDAAAARVRYLLDKRENPAAGIRVRVKKGGCSGLSYVIEYADEVSPFDEKIEDKGITLFIDPKAIIFLLGSQMDYIEEKLKSGFVFINPNEKGTCGCGESFYV